MKGTTTKVANLPQNPQSFHSPTAIPRILEEESRASLRDTALAVARQSNSAQAESNQINGACKARNLESVVGGLGGQRGDKGGELANSSPLSPLERTLSQTKLESSNNAQKVDSSSLSSRAAQSGVAIHSLESSFAKVDSRARAVDSMDCHADKSARNDRSSATSQKHSNYMEYYMFNEPAWNTFDPQVAQNSLGKLQRIVKVPLLTLGEVLHTYVPKGVEIDFLSIDCEGFDLSVLRSNDWESFVPHIIIVEILTNIYGELDMVALQDNEIARFLFSKGYALVAKAHNSVIFQHKDKR